MDKPKPFEISKILVWDAYKQVKANKGGAGVYQESLEEFDKKLSKNLYKIWNRLSSASYFSPAVRGVEIPKKQGGIISPILSNLFMHYVFDIWMTRNHPESLWCRYADDGVCHCKTREQAEELLAELEIHPDKAKIVYCKNGSRKTKYDGNTSFVFLGYEFRVRAAKNKSTKQIFGSFILAISPKAKKDIITKIRGLGIRNRLSVTVG